MRKILPFLVVGILVLGGLGAVAGTEIDEKEFISETIVFSEPIVREAENYVTVELAEATTNLWQKGKPMLPVVTKTYTFPFGTKIGDVEITFSDIVEEKITKPITPSPEVQIISNTVTNKKTEEIMTYSDITIYPENRYSYSIAAGLKDEENVIYLSLALYPDQYSPKENTIYHSKEASIDIKYTLPEKPVNFPEEYDLLILTPTEFKSALQTLVNNKNGLNPQVKTVMVSLDEIPPLGGVDEQENIKLYIRQAKETWGIDYVLLVGAGVEGSEIFPVRTAYISDEIETYFPSDLYYADFYDGTGGFPNWDKDGDGKYAEYQDDKENVDVLPDVYIARLACNDVGEVNTVVNKIIQYKDKNKMTNKILQMGGDTFTDDPDDQMEGEYANTVVMTKLPGYSTTQLWGSKGNLKKSTIAAGFKSSVDFADFSGHGSWASWATHPPYDENTWIPPKEGLSQYTGWLYADYDVFFVNNGKKLPVVVFNSCSNNKYTDSDRCLGWKTVSKSGGGGIASYAAAGIGYGSPGHETERVMGWMEVHSFEELYNIKIMGQVWAHCVSDYYTTFFGQLDKEDYKTMLEFCMLGDPTLPAQDGDHPGPRFVNQPIILKIIEMLGNHYPRLAKIFEKIFI